MPQEALATSNEGPFVDQCPEPEVIAIDFYDSGGEARIFQRLEPEKVGRALLNGRDVWVRRFTLNGKQEVMILRKGNPYQGGNWQTWGVMRETLKDKGKEAPAASADGENLGTIARGFTQELEAVAARRAGRMGIPKKRDEGSEETRGNALGIYLRDHIDGSPKTTVDLEIRGLIIRIKGGNLNVAAGDFFSVLEKHLSRLGSIQQITQPHQISHSTIAFNGQWKEVAFNAMRALAVTLDPTQNFRIRPNVNGDLEVRSEYSTVSGFAFLIFEYQF